MLQTLLILGAGVVLYLFVTYKPDPTPTASDGEPSRTSDAGEVPVTGTVSGPGGTESPAPVMLSKYPIIGLFDDNAYMSLAPGAGFLVRATSNPNSRILGPYEKGRPGDPFLAFVK